MRRLIAVALTLSAAGLGTAPAAAQEELLQTCATVQPVANPDVELSQNVVTQFRFLCGLVVNSLSTVQPTVGIALSGGAHTLGTATTLGRTRGGRPGMAITARFNAALADVPDLLNGYVPRFESSGVLGPMGTDGIPVGSFQADATVGLFNGFYAGPSVGGLGAIDLLASVAYVPAVEEVGLEESIINAGIGARVGILKQGLILPGLSVSAMYRTMLRDLELGSLAEGDPAEFATDLSTFSLRVGASKGVLAFDLAAGAGYDVYTSDVSLAWQLDCPPDLCDGQDVTLTSAPLEGTLQTAAWNLHGNVGLNLVVVSLVGELGYQKATKVLDLEALRDAGLPAQAPTARDLDGGRFFASVGARIRF